LFGQYSLSGTVVDAVDKPVRDAFVQLQPGNHFIQTNGVGFFEFRDLGEAMYELTVNEGRAIQRWKLILSGDTVLSLKMARVLTLDQVTVKALSGGMERTPSEEIIQSETIEKRDFGQDVPFLLEWTPSMVVTSDAGTGIGYTGMRIRGTDPTRINVTINGIPLNDAESQNVFWVDLPDILSSAQNVSIQRGVGSSTNGAAAFGASVDLNTNRFEPDPYARIEGSVGSFNTRKASASFGSGLIKDHFSIDGRFSIIQSDGYVDRASADLRSYYMSANWVEDRWNLRYNLFSGREITYQAWFGIPKEWLDDEDLRKQNPAGTEKPGEPYEDQVDNYTQTHHQLFFNYQISNDWDISLAGHYTKGFGFFEEYAADQFLPDYGLEQAILGGDTIPRNDLVRRRWLDNDFGGIIGSIQGNITPGIRLIAGGGWNRYVGHHFGEVIWAEWLSNGEKDHIYYDNDAVKRDFNLYTKWIFRLSSKWNVFVDAQIRSIYYNFLGVSNEGNPLRDEISLLFFNPKAGFTYYASAKSTLSLNLGVAGKEPNRNDYVESNPASRPRPETLYNAELGWDHRVSERFEFGLNGYLMYYLDQLVLTGELNDVGAYTRTNVDRSYRIGLEVMTKAKLVDGLEINGNFTVSDNRIIEFTEFLDTYDENFGYEGQTPLVQENTELAFSPAFIGMLGLEYSFYQSRNTHLSAWVQGKYISSQQIANASDGSNQLDPYGFANGGVSCDLSIEGLPEISLQFAIFNLTNNLYAANAWSYRYLLDGEVQIDQGFYPQATRNYQFKVALNF
jgi:iron complex outermembrane receptor protein